MKFTKSHITRVFAAILATFAVFLLCSCGTEEDKPFEPKGTAKELLDSGMSALALPEATELYRSDDALYAFDNDILSGKYCILLEAPLVSDMSFYAAYFSDNPYGPEFGVFRMTDNAAAEKMKEYLDHRIDSFLKNAKNYPSVDTTAFENYTVAVRGEWIYYCCADNAAPFVTLMNGYFG